MLSHKYKFIFIHIPKTGGVSISSLLLWRYPVLTFWEKAKILLRISAILRKSLLPRSLTWDDYWIDIHGKYYHYIQQYGKETWDNYYKFTFVRDPWSRLVSSFFYLDRGGNNPLDKRLSDMYIKKYKGDFNEFVNDFVAADKIKHLFHMHPQHEFICDQDGRLLVDFVGKFENIQEDFDKLCDRFRLPHTPLPHENKTLYQKAQHHKRYYNDKSREIVAEKYARDIHLFGYKFD